MLNKTLIKRFVVMFFALALLVIPAVAQDDSSVVIAQGTDAASLDPQLQNDAFTTSILSNVFDTLIYRTQDLDLVPGLATEWTNVDDTTWELTLREGVTFHNGEAFTAEDVEFTLERPLNPDLGSPLSGRFSVIEDVEVVDDLTVRVNTAGPYPLLPERLSEWFVIPKDYFEANDAAFLSENPVGTGPYQFVEWVKDTRLVLEAYADHWRGEPEIQNVTFRPIPETSTRVAALQSSEVDVITNVPAFRQAEFETDDNVEIRAARSTFIQYVALDGTKNEVLSDERVRQAIRYATNVPEIVEFLFDGLAEPVDIPLALGTFGYDPTIEGYDYNPALARELLTEAGYPDGISFAMDAPTGRYAQDAEVAQALVGQWAEAGINVDLNINAWADQLSKYRDGDALVESHFMGWGTSTFDADDILFNAFARQPTKNNYSNEEVTSILEEARSTFDRGQREQLYSEALEIINEESPWVPLFQQFDIYGVNADLIWSPRQDQKIEVRTMSFAG